MMQSEHEVFTEALSFTEAAARTEYLDRVCGTDRIKRQRLNELLKLHESVDSVLDRRPQEMIEALSDGVDPADSTHCSSEMMIASLRPFLEPAIQPDSLGRLSHYELLEVLGQGGYGIVFKALDTKLHRLVAIKVLSPHLATTSPPRRRFLREARAAAAVRHEHVVQIYAVEEAPIPYLVMEFVSGETLQQRSDRLGPFEASDVIRLGQQIARGLSAAHQQGLIHRDIKPGNILITDEMEPVAKLSDFGLARTVDDASRSQSGVVIGTPMYMSPEQVSGEEVDQRTDLFSLGSVLYLMTSGRPPFRATSTLAVLKRVAEDKPRSIPDVIPNIPDGLCRVISKLHSKSRDGRYSTARDAELALADCLNQPKLSWSGRLTKVAFDNWKVTTVALISIAIIALVIREYSDAASGLKRRDNEILAQAALSSEPPTGTAAVPTMPIANSTSPTEKTSDATIAKESIEPVTTPAGTTIPQSEPVEQIVEPIVPLTEWEKSVMAMKMEDQVSAVRAKLKELNPKINEAMFHFHQSDEGFIHEIQISHGAFLTDITPLRALRKLKKLRILLGNCLSDLRPLQGLPLEFLEIDDHPIRDLTPLKGMPLSHLSFWPFAGDDLSPLRGMKLRSGNLGGGRILRNLEPLRGMPIEMMCFNHTAIEDLSPLKGMPLRRLEIQYTKVKDVSPLSDAPLEFLGAAGTPITDFSPLKMCFYLRDIHLDYSAERDKKLLQALPALTGINGKPAMEFLENP